MSQFLDKMGDWLTFLAETDEDYGRLWGLVQAMEYLVKDAEAEGYHNASGTQEERKTAARMSQAYRKATERHVEALTEFRTLQAQRKTVELKIEALRTAEVSRRG